MKHALLLPPLILLVMTGLVVAFGTLLAVVGVSVSALPTVLPPVLLVSVSLAVVTGLNRAIRRPLAAVPAFLLVLVTVALVTVGAHLLYTLRGPVDSAVVTRAAERGSILPHTIYHGSRFAVVVADQTGADLSDVVVIDYWSTASARVNRYPAAYWNRADGLLILPDGPDVPTDRLTGFGRPELPAVVRNSIDDVLIFVDHIERSWRAALPPRLQEVLPSVAAAAARPALTVLVVALAIAAVWTPVRFSRWPLLNVVVAVAYLRLLVAVPRIAWVPWLESAVWRRARSWVVDDRVLLMWAAMAIVLLIAAVALPSLTRWRHAMHYQENAT